jgi:hypothetical protein
MDVESWRAFTKPKMREYLEEKRKRTGNTDGGPHYKTVLAVRQRLSPVDMYCYLKARFGEPNGVQNILRSDSSDNWIHWEYSLRPPVAVGRFSICNKSLWICDSACFCASTWLHSRTANGAIPPHFQICFIRPLTTRINGLRRRSRPT